MAEFDFKEVAQGLLKRLTGPTSVNPALALAALETALREAYARGKEASGSGSAAGVRPLKAVAAARPTPQLKPARPPEEEGCAHEWEETFLDARAVGSKCRKCDMLERDVQSRCDHFYVQTPAGDVCVACRKPKRGTAR